MKNAKVEGKKIVKAAQPRRVAGVPVRSGVKAGLGIEYKPGDPGHPGGLGKPGHELG
jgi:hypothetical protein